VKAQYVHIGVSDDQRHLSDKEKKYMIYEQLKRHPDYYYYKQRVQTFMEMTLSHWASSSRNFKAL